MNLRRFRPVNVTDDESSAHKPKPRLDDNCAIVRRETPEHLHGRHELLSGGITLALEHSELIDVFRVNTTVDMSGCNTLKEKGPFLCCKALKRRWIGEPVRHFSMPFTRSWSRQTQKHRARP